MRRVGLPAGRWGLLMSLALVACRPTPPSATVFSPSPCRIDRLSWLAGCWHGERRKVRTRECWLAPKGGMLLGVHRDVPPRGPAFFEYLRVEARQGRVLYLASPRGRAATPFGLTKCGPRRAVFSNPRHDFPQRITYWIDSKGRLHARIGGPQKGKWITREWIWSRVPSWSAPGSR